jgi:hypothetical protein
MPHNATFITLCEAILGITPHFALWRWLFQEVPSFPNGAFLAMGGAQIQVCPLLLASTSPSCVRGLRWPGDVAVDLVLPPKHGPSASFLHGAPVRWRHPRVMAAIPLGSESD